MLELIIQGKRGDGHGNQWGSSKVNGEQSTGTPQETAGIGLEATEASGGLRQREAAHSLSWTGAHHAELAHSQPTVKLLNSAAGVAAVTTKPKSVTESVSTKRGVPCMEESSVFFGSGLSVRSIRGKRLFVSYGGPWKDIFMPHQRRTPASSAMILHAEEA
jgi:hypothetical protein